MSQSQKYAIFVAGGTGGHIHAALSLGDRFKQEGYRVKYYSGQRPLDYQLFSGREVTHLPAKPLKGSLPFGLFGNFFNNLLCFIRVWWALFHDRPTCMLGAGGYVCGPTLLAGFVLRVPVYILEQNSVMGITNKILVYLSRKIFLNFTHTRGVPERFQPKSVITGNPIKTSFKEFFQLRKETARSLEGEWRVLVFGGSLGAGAINDLIQDFIKLQPPFKLSIRHQTGRDFTPKAKPQEVHPMIHYEHFPFFNHMEKEYAWADMVVCRSGASTISELRLVQLPALLLPYPHHADRHQFYNAENLQQESSFMVLVENEKELQQEQCKKFSMLLQKIKDQSMNGDSQVSSSRQTKTTNVINPLQSVDLIFQEMTQNV